MTEKLLSIEDLKKRFPGVSERALREKIRRVGAYCQIGNKLFLTEADFVELIESLRPKREKWHGNFPAAPPLGDYTKLLEIRKKARKKTDVRQQQRPRTRKPSPRGDE